MNTDKLKLLLALQEDPVAPAAELAKQVGVTPPTARAWLDSLRDDKVYVSVQANILGRRLGLETDDFLLKVDSYDSLEKIEQFCEAHPYTSYRARVFGGDDHGIMVQFTRNMAAVQPFMRHTDLSGPDEILILLADRTLAGMETDFLVLHPENPDIFRQHTVHPSQQTVGRNGGIRVKVRSHSKGVHPGIGSAGTMKMNHIPGHGP